MDKDSDSALTWHFNPNKTPLRKRKKNDTIFTPDDLMVIPMDRTPPSYDNHTEETLLKESETNRTAKLATLRPVGMSYLPLEDNVRY